MGLTDFKRELRKESRIGIDSACLIYLFEQNNKYAELAEYVLRRADQIYLSAIGVTEIFTGVRRFKNEHIFQTYLEFFTHFEKLRIISVDFEIADLASVLRVNYGLKTPDAIHIATAINQKASAFITNDNGLKKVKEIKIICLNDYTER